MNIRKPNRVSRPARVTQHGQTSTYPHADFAAMARNRNRWALVEVKRDVQDSIRERQRHQ